MSKFTTICHTIRAGLLVAASEAINYKTWDADFARTNLDDKVKDLQHYVISENMGLHVADPRRRYRFDKRDNFILTNYRFLLTPPNKINEDQLKRLDFLRYRGPREGLELWLIPLYLAPFLAPGHNVYSINGKVKITGPDIDLDHRQGILTFGWMLEAGKAFPDNVGNGPDRV